MKSQLTKASLAVASLLLVFGATTAQAAIGTIVGSKHDFTTGTYRGTNNAVSPTGQVCIYCHAPHNNTNAAGNLLWNRAASAATYIPYSSPTMQASPAPSATINAISKVCLSCHDGSIAVDSFGTFTGSVVATGTALIGPNLSNDHPISFVYNATLVTADPGLRAVSTAATIGAANVGTIESKMLFGATGAATLECASCHDVHNSLAGTAVQSKLLKITTDGSKLCITCHAK